MKKPQKKWTFNIRLIFIMMILFVFAIISIAASAISALLYEFFQRSFELPEAIYAVIISIILGTIVTTFLSSKILSPITKLTEAMSKVAQGDFTIKLESESRINEIQDLYSNFNLMVTELAATEMLQSDFVSNVSHEFKTPINAIEGYTMLLQEESLLSSEQTEYTEKILFNTKRLSGLVSNILLLSRIENQAIPARWDRFRLDEQVRQAIVSLQPKWEKKEIVLEADLEEISYLGNEPLLLHIWLNLIDNAIKFNPVGGSIIIRLEATKQSVFVSVQDGGCGVSEGDKARIFDRFYQADSSHKDEGNGLGLALANRIAAIHHGYIEVQNCPTGGCKFTVVLPEPI